MCIAISKVFEWESREYWEWEEEQAAAETEKSGGIWVMGGSHCCSNPYPPSWQLQVRSRPLGVGFLCVSLCLSFVIFLVHLAYSWNSPGSRVKGEYAMYYHDTDCRWGKTGKNIHHHDLNRSNMSMIKPSKPATNPDNHASVDHQFTYNHWHTTNCLQMKGNQVRISHIAVQNHQWATHFLPIHITTLELATTSTKSWKVEAYCFFYRWDINLN